MRILRFLLFVIVLLVATVALGRMVAAASVDAGIDRYPMGSPERAVAETAARSAASLGRRLVLPKPLFFLLPELRVTGVRLAAGHCNEYPPGSFPHMDYMATVQIHTLFGIPVRSLTVQCGGNFL